MAAERLGPSRSQDRPLSFKDFSYDSLYREMNEGVVRAALQNVQDGDVVLDDACANGVNSDYALQVLASAGIDATVAGADINRHDLKEAKKDVRGVYFIEADATRLPLEDNWVKVALLMNAIHEIEGKSLRVIDGQSQEVDNKDLALQELFRVCKPGGEAVVLTGFTAEMFNFPDNPRSARQEVAKHNEIRKRAFGKLGQERDKKKKPFTPISTNTYVEKTQQAGFINIQVKVVYIPFVSQSMRRIGYDPAWLNGTFQDMTNTETISLAKKRDAYLEVIDELEAEHEARNPGEPLLYPRNFVVITARKPIIQEAKAG